VITVEREEGRVTVDGCVYYLVPDGDEHPGWIWVIKSGWLVSIGAISEMGVARVHGTARRERNKRAGLLDAVYRAWFAAGSEGT
jgi:hypothetical protein